MIYRLKSHCAHSFSQQCNFIMRFSKLSFLAVCDLYISVWKIANKTPHVHRKHKKRDGLRRIFLCCWNLWSNSLLFFIRSFSLFFSSFFLLFTWLSLWNNKLKVNLIKPIFFSGCFPIALEVHCHIFSFII